MLLDRFPAEMLMAHGQKASQVVEVASHLQVGAATIPHQVKVVEVVKMTHHVMEDLCE